jgi:hypothetical protein
MKCVINGSELRDLTPYIDVQRWANIDVLQTRDLKALVWLKVCEVLDQKEINLSHVI